MECSEDLRYCRTWASWKGTMLGDGMFLHDAPQQWLPTAWISVRGRARCSWVNTQSQRRGWPGDNSWPASSSDWGTLQ